MFNLLILINNNTGARIMKTKKTHSFHQAVYSQEKKMGS